MLLAVLMLVFCLLAKARNPTFFSCSTWVKSKFCSWSGIEGNGKASVLTPEERRSQACRCLDSWDASTTSCLMRPSAPWPSSLQVREDLTLSIDSSIDGLSSTIPWFLFHCFPHLQRSKGSLYTRSWLKGSSPCWTTSCSTWWVLRWEHLKWRTSVSLTSSHSSLFLTSAPSTWIWGMLWALVFVELLIIEKNCKYLSRKNVVFVLGSDEENFCATVPKDGRSYSPTLFSQTVRVLKKINKPGDMIVAFGLLADKIKVPFDCL